MSDLSDSATPRDSDGALSFTFSACRDGEHSYCKGFVMANATTLVDENRRCDCACHDARLEWL